MKFGMPTLIGCSSLEENLALCRELKLDFLELNMNLPQAQLGELKKFRWPGDTGITLHLPEELNVWDFNPLVREAYGETVKETIAYAQERGITLLNMHMNRGVYFTLPERKVYLFEEYREDFLENTVRFRELVEGLVSPGGLHLYIENTGVYNRGFVREALDILLESDRFLLTWDVGHDYASGWKDSETLMPLGAKIGHMHLHDGLRGENHLPLGSGEIDIASVLERFPDLPGCVLETKTKEGLIRSLEYLNRGTASGFRF